MSWKKFEWIILIDEENEKKNLFPLPSSSKKKESWKLFVYPSVLRINEVIFYIWLVCKGRERKRSEEMK